MAVNFKALVEDLEKTPLTKEELKIINTVENWIDERIKERFDGGSVSFDTDVIEFNFNPDAPSDRWYNIKSTRKELMSKELKRRYEDAGWKIKREEGEDDGPNRPAIPYYVLKGK